MPKPAGAEVADALVAALNTASEASTFPLQFAAERSWQAAYSMEDFVTLKVTVTPSARATERESKAHNRNTHTILVTFQKQVEAENDDQFNEKVDELGHLVEAVADWMDKKKISAAGQDMQPPAPPVIDPLAALDDLDESRVFTSVISVGYRERRSVP